MNDFLDFLKRLPSGNVWIPSFSPNGVGIKLLGDPAASPRGTPGWREDWNWVVFETEHYCNFHLYFSTRHLCMRHLGTIKTRYVAVRLGPDDVFFIAEEYAIGGGREIGLSRVLGDDTKENIQKELRLLGIPDNNVTWV